MADNDAPTLEELEADASVADTLRAAMKGQEAAEETPATEPEPETETASEARARDEKGRFAPKETAEATDGEVDKEAAAEEVPAEGETEQPAEPDAEDEDPLDPRPDWTLEEQNAFRALPVAGQKLVMDKLAAAESKAEEVSKESGRYHAIEQVLAPRRDAWARDGFTEDQILRQLFALSDYASEKPQEFIQYFAKQRGIDLARMVQPEPQQAAEGDPYADDPFVQNLKGQITQLQQEISKIGGTLQTREQQEQEARQKEMDTQIQSFAGERDDKGALKHPYFEAVKPVMASLMQVGRASDLQTAYDMACRADPDVWAKIEAANKAAADREQARKQREKAAAASKAGSSVSGTPGARSEPQPTGDLREDLRAQFAERGMASVI